MEKKLQELSTSIPVDFKEKEGEQRQDSVEAWTVFNSTANLWTTQALGGDSFACTQLLAQREELEKWLDTQDRLIATDPALREVAVSEKTGYPYSRPAAAWLKQGLPDSVEELQKQYALLKDKSGRMDFKSDIQSIECAILGGSIDALKEVIGRAPMALWAMDFALSEYEGQNVLAFVCKYAPVGPDLEIITYLRELGVRMPESQSNHVTSRSVRCEAGLWSKWSKSPKHTVKALDQAGHEFTFMDGYMILEQKASVNESNQARIAMASQQIEWLEELERRGIDWTLGLTVEQCEEIVSVLLPLDPEQPKRGTMFVDYARSSSTVGLGYWIGLSHAASKGVAFWNKMGPFLAKRGLATQALEAAKISGNEAHWSMVLAYVEHQEVTEVTSQGMSVSKSQRSLRI